jgi:carboxylesterase type B
MQDAWLAFARTGDPGADWPRYDLDDRTVRSFDAESGTVADPGAEARQFWATVEL